jgi:hypothetical protein
MGEQITSANKYCIIISTHIQRISKLRGFPKKTCRYFFYFIWALKIEIFVEMCSSSKKIVNHFCPKIETTCFLWAAIAIIFILVAESPCRRRPSRGRMHGLQVPEHGPDLRHVKQDPGAGEHFIKLFYD